MQTAYTVLILLMLVSLSRLVGRLIPLPLPLVQIAAGALLAWPTLGLHVALDPELFLFLFLPTLLFSDGWRMPKRELWKLRGPILTLAVGLVLFTVVGAGYFIHWILPSIPLPVAFALAAVLSPTDAVAVSAISQDRLPTPLMHMLQGEALMNDASGLVTFKFALVAAITGVFSLAEASVTFVLVAVGGLAIDESEAKVHTVDGTFFLVTPGIFQRYAAEYPVPFDGNDKIEGWRRTQRHFENLGVHLKRPNGQNIWTCKVKGPRKTSSLNGYLLRDATCIFIEPLTDNPFLTLCS